MKMMDCTQTKLRYFLIKKRIGYAKMDIGGQQPLHLGQQETAVLFVLDEK